VPYYAARIAFETGDLRAAQLADVLELEAEVLRLLGRRADAEATLLAARDALGANADACRRAAHLTNSSLVLFDDGEDPEHAAAPIPLLEKAIAVYRSGCPEPAPLANALTNLAVARLALGDVERAGAHLSEARRAKPPRDVVLEADWIALEGRIAMRRNQARRALDFYEQLSVIAEWALLANARWQAALGRAQALEALGRMDPARDAYTEAERLLDEASRHAPVEYGVDLAAQPSAPAEGSPMSALVVADPRGDLPSARAEAQRIAGLLRERGGFEPLVLQGREATHRAVCDALELTRTGLFHYAGHGIFEGRDGWESGFPLAAGGWLSVGDVLVLRRAPDRVLLSGCETARAPSGSSASGLGLAQAFIVAGSRAVVASPRPVDDALAERVMTALYRALSKNGGIDLAASLREAELAVRKESPETDWAAFRVLVP